MTEFYTPQIAENVYYVGVKDPERRLFDSLIPLPQGTTYNAYLIKDEKTALIDTVNPGFEQELEQRITQNHPLDELDYIIMNHAEPDHAAAIPYLLEKTKATLVATKRGADAAKTYFNVPENRVKIVEDNETLSLGAKTLRFIVAPMLHWPETMFTYLEEDKILFPCDFLGLHTAYGLYDDEVPQLLEYAQRYFGEIMMPYRSMGKRGLDKIKHLDVSMIAPSHGPIHRNPETIMEAYEKWTNGETEEKALIVYASMWRSTEKMVQQIAETLRSNGIDTPVYNLASADIGDIARDLVDSKAIILGTPTVLNKMHPLAVYATHLVTVLNPPAKYAVALTSYGWGKGALKHAAELLKPTGLEIIGAVEVNGPPQTEDLKEIISIGQTLAEKIKQK